MKTEKAVREFLSHYAAHGRPSAKEYGPPLRRFVAGCGTSRMGAVRLPESTDKVAAAMYREGLDNNTVWYSMTVIRLFMRFHRDRGNTSQNPSLVRIPKRVMRRQRGVTDEEHRRMVDSCEVSSFGGIRDALVLMLLHDTGMRVSELSRMRLSDVDADRRLCRIVTSKTRAEDLVCWSEETAGMIEDLYMPVRENLMCGSEFLLVSKVSPNGWWRDGITPRGIQRIVRKAAQRCGIGGVTPHKYRHAKARRIHDRGGTLADIRNILRHSGLSSSLAYLNAFEREDAERMRRFL
jgi:integrase/recombinase XerD